MLPDRRAVVFDLDDTLYAYRRFVLSGFRQVARSLQWTHGVREDAVFRSLARASRGPQRGRELQWIIAQLALPERELDRLVALVRQHDPQMRLPQPTRQLLARLRAAGWRLGVLTNGAPDIQARKVRALGVSRYVDAVVYAAACGTGRGKPDPAAFREVAARLGVPPRDVVFVGDDEVCDVEGALAAGMRAVRCGVWRHEGQPSRSHAVVRRFSQIPGLARVLLEEASGRYAA